MSVVIYILKQNIVDFATCLDNRSTHLDNRNTSVHCKVCRKNFSTENAYENHLNSKKRKVGVLEGTSPVLESQIGIREDFQKTQVSNDSPKVKDSHSTSMEVVSDN